MEMEEVKIATEMEIKVAWMETAMEMEIMEVSVYWTLYAWTIQIFKTYYLSFF